MASTLNTLFQLERNILYWRKGWNDLRRVTKTVLKKCTNKCNSISVYNNSITQFCCFVTLVIDGNVLIINNLSQVSHGLFFNSIKSNKSATRKCNTNVFHFYVAFFLEGFSNNFQSSYTHDISIRTYFMISQWS